MKGITVLYRWNDETSSEIVLERGHRFDVQESGNLMVWDEDAHLIAAYAPGVWRSAVSEEAGSA